MLPWLFLFLFTTVRVDAQESLLDKKISVHPYHGWEFQAICLALQVPCAIEINNDSLPVPDTCSAGYGLDGARDKMCDYSIQNIRAASVLDQVIKMYPKHRWSYTAGVLKVYPRDKIPEDSLDVPLGKVEFHVKQLYYLAQFVESKARLSPGLVSVVDHRINRNPNYFSLTMDTATARQALTAGVVAEGRAAWIVHYENRQSEPVEFLDLLDYDLEAQAGDATSWPKVPSR